MATNLQTIPENVAAIFDANHARYSDALFLVLDDCRGFCEDSFWQRLVFLNDNDEQEERYFYA